MADVVIYEKEPPHGTPEGAKGFSRDDVEGFIEFIIGRIKEYEEERVD